MTQQGLRQASARAISGTALDYNGDLRAMFAAEATIDAGMTFNGAFIKWLQTRLGSSDGHLGNLMQAFAAQEGADNWSGLGSFDPFIVTDGLVAHWKFDDGAGDTVTDYSGNGFHLQLGPTSGADANQPTWSATGVDCIIDNSANSIRANSDLGLFTGVTDKTLIFVTQAKIATNSWRLFGIPGAGLTDHMRVYNSGQAIRLERNGGQGFNTALELVDETWHFVAVTQDGTNTFEETTIYLDGASEVPDFFNNVIAPDENLFLAGFDGNGSSKWIKYAYGMVYDRALSGAEIAQNRTALTALLAGRGITLP